MCTLYDTVLYSPECLAILEKPHAQYERPVINNNHVKCKI